MPGRRTAAEVERYDQLIIDIVMREQPLSVRRLHYALIGIGEQYGRSPYATAGQRSLILRRNGLIPRGSFVDNTRVTLIPKMFDSLEHAITQWRREYRLDPWLFNDKPDRVMVMSEKDTVRGILWPVLHALGVTFGIARGRASETWLEDLADDINDEMETEYDGTLHLAYIGDWDPTGWHNPLDIEQRLRGFLDEPDRLHFTRLSLNPEQVEELNLSPNIGFDITRDPNYPRWPGGNTAYELDAVPSPTLRGWVSDFVRQYIDQSDLDAATAATSADLERLDDLLDGDDED